MKQHHQEKRREVERPDSEQTPTLNQESLTDAAKQETFRKAHLEQLRRRQCYGCGEREIF